MSLRYAGTLCLSLLASCNLLTSPICTANIVPAVIVHITDAQSGAPLAEGAAGLVRDGSYWDHLRPSRYLPVGDSWVMIARQSAEERPGTYRIEVSHPGYAPAFLTGLQVERGDCHVLTREVEIQLTPLQ